MNPDTARSGKVLVSPVAAGRKKRLAETATQRGSEILAVAVMPDPVHLLVSGAFEFAPAEIIRLSEG